MKKLLSILLIIMIIITFIQIRNVYSLYKDQISGQYEGASSNWYIKINGADIVKTNGQTATFEMTADNIGYADDEGKMKLGTGALAPDTNAAFTIIIDPKNDAGETTDVAMKYQIAIESVKQYVVYKEEGGTTTSEIFDLKDPNTGTSLPFTFEILSVEDTFAESFDADGNPVNTDNTSEHKNKIDVNLDPDTGDIKNHAYGVIPLSTIKDGNVDKVSVAFKWKVEDDSLDEATKEKYKKMYDDMLKHNNGSNETVKLIVPITVNVKQYLGEEL